uniref:Transmembrane protein n=1 Tax=Heterorhabditis bacteriophora TaxID=37862 RepID=A0A1I7W6I4_HETBA
MLTFQGARTTIYKMTQDGQEERMVIFPTPFLRTFTPILVLNLTGVLGVTFLDKTKMRTTIEQYYQPFKLVCIVVPYFSIRSH